MLDDFFNSARGPGIVGLLLATVVLAFLCVIGVNAFTESDGPDLSKQIAAQKVRIQELGDDVAANREKLAKREEFKERQVDLAAMKEALGALKDEEALLLSRVRRGEEKLAEIEAAFVAYQKQYRESERARAVGETIDLSATHGEKFKQVKITRVNPSALGVMTQSGPKRIGYEELPEALRDRFQFDADESQQYLADRKKMEAARDRAIQQANREKAEKTEEWREAQRERDRE